MLVWQIKIYINYLAQSFIYLFIYFFNFLDKDSSTFVVRSHIDPVKIFKWRSRVDNKATCSSTSPSGIVFPFSGMNFLQDRHRDARYRTSQPSLDTLTLSHINFARSIVVFSTSFRLFLHLAFFYLAFHLSTNNLVLNHMI